MIDIEEFRKSFRCKQCGKERGLLIDGKCINCAPELFKLRR